MLINISVTFKNKKEAIKIARFLLEKKLVVCANIFPVSSLYWWAGKINSGKEVMAIFKTLSSKIQPVKKVITNLCSYQLPVIVIEKIDLNPAAKQWLKRIIK